MIDSYILFVLIYFVLDVVFRNGNDRSGLFCAVAAIMAQLRTQQKVNIPQAILQLRRRRPQLIPNLVSIEQFLSFYIT